jgi:hypothetical protein
MSDAGCVTVCVAMVGKLDSRSLLTPILEIRGQDQRN